LWRNWSIAFFLEIFISISPRVSAQVRTPGVKCASDNCQGCHLPKCRRRRR
jgi:hypothetical protein